jgi:hypothetical protein
MCLSSGGSSSGSLKPGRIRVSAASNCGEEEGEVGGSGQFGEELGRRGELEMEGRGAVGLGTELM